MILVTGGAGCIGSHMTLALVPAGYAVVELTTLDTSVGMARA
ncbi:NAD-dependent epimerase/dehydratase family protein [Acidovorax sp.]